MIYGRLGYPCLLSRDDDLSST